MKRRCKTLLSFVFVALFAPSVLASSGAWERAIEKAWKP